MDNYKRIEEQIEAMKNKAYELDKGDGLGRADSETDMQLLREFHAQAQKEARIDELYIFYASQLKSNEGTSRQMGNLRRYIRNRKCELWSEDASS